MISTLSPKKFADAIGVSESSIRRWADDGRLQISRTSGGHRKISLTEAVRFIRENATHVSRPELLGIPLIDEQSREMSSLQYRELLLSALQSGHAQSVTSLLFAMYLNKMSVADICDGPIHFALSRIGELWPSKPRGIFLEHRATMLCMRGLNQLRLALPEINEQAPIAIGGAPQDDPYILPTLMVSLVLHEAGYNEINLGPGTPLDVMVDAVEDEKPQLVWLAVTTPLRSRLQSEGIYRLSESACSLGCRFIMGGRSVDTYQGKPLTVCRSFGELARYIKISG